MMGKKEGEILVGIFGVPGRGGVEVLPGKV